MSKCPDGRDDCMVNHGGISRGRIFNHRDGQKELDMFDRKLLEDRIHELKDREAALLARVERLQFALAEINAGCERHHVNGEGSFCRNEDHEIVRQALSDDKHE